MINSNEETIAAIATPYAQGGIGIIRISGSDAKRVANRIFVPKNKTIKIENLEGYRALLGHVVDQDLATLDEAVLLNFNAPKSYTGEDVVELSVHSGLYILKQLLRSALAAGARIAEPGEFTKRAFLNQKLSLTQAEAVMDLISAGTKQAYTAAFDLKQGALHKKIAEISEDILDLSSHIAAFIDYPEEEVELVDIEKLESKIKQILDELRTLLESYESGKMIKEGISVAVVGKPNVGKSTIMNLLARCDKSIVTDVPGTTRDVIEESVNLDGIMLNIADTAGIRQTCDVVENIGVKRAIDKLNQAYLILAIFDASRPVDELDNWILKETSGKNVIAVINKLDLPLKLNREYIKSKVSCVVEGSTHDKNFRNLLSEAITKKIGMNAYSGCVLANERQYNCVQQAIDRLEEVQKTLKTGTLDVISTQMEEALSFLYELTGQNTSDSILYDVFNRFCIGK
ncbi:tRNA modification GTPase MnmE [Clostridia bacterium]|nr:tRNA modification GTPase MnmE [Clostridia bacterium]